MRRLAFLLILLLSGGTIEAQKQPLSPARELPANEPLQAVLPVEGSGPHAVEFTFEVPDDVFRVEIAISESQADLDIELSLDYLSGYRSETLLYNESLVLSRTSDPYLETGTAVIRVLYQFDLPPTLDGRRLTEIPFVLKASTESLSDRIGLVSLDDSVEGTLYPETGMVDVYRLRLPRGVQNLRLDLSDTDGDLDLFVFPDTLYADPFLAAFTEQSVRSTESLIISSQSDPPLSAGIYYVMVLDQVSVDAPVSYALHASSSEQAPAALLELPQLKVPPSPLENALLATVEVVTPDGGGSGCVVSPDGYVITNWHVVEGPDGNAWDDITIGFSTDHTRPPREAFRAEVVEYAPDRDLALLRITGGRYGQALPAEMQFPFHELHDRELSIAMPLRFVGYPWIGGTGSRASISYTQGAVAGFQRTSFGLLIKSDGEINSGNSGGAALDNRYRLVGFPSSVVAENAGQLAYVVPVPAIPADWRRRIGR